MKRADDITPRTPGRYPAASRGVLVNLTAFSRVLREAGVQVSLSQVIDAARSLDLVDVSQKPDFYVTLRSNMVSDRADIATFDRLFDRFWSRRPWGDGSAELPARHARAPVTRRPACADEGGGPAESAAPDPRVQRDPRPDAERFRIAISGSDAALFEKDFGALGVDEGRAVERAIRRMAPLIATQLGRRKRRTLKEEEIDPRRTMRRSLRYGGEIVELAFRRRRMARTRIVLVCDVSGSMDCYSRFLIQFMYGLQNQLCNVETFVFSTYLSRITGLMHTRDIGQALERISVSLLGWSGGTHIGSSLRTLNERFAHRLVTSRTLVVIISDGWERGDTTLLAQEMRTLRRRCHRIFWLNPLCSSARPMRTFCKGMEAALPHLDLLAPANNLRSLVDLARTLQRLAV